MADKKFERKKLLVDPKTQVALISRLWLYWGSSVVTLLALHSIVLSVPRFFGVSLGSGWVQFIPILIGTLMFVPIITYDMLKLTNRIIGPVFRLRRELRRLANGEQVQPLKFRKGDLWYGFDDDFNAILVRVQHAQPQKADESQDDAETREPVGAGAE